MNKKFKPFHETFRACSFAMALSLVYPNESLNIFKVKAAIAVLTFNSYAILSFVSSFIFCVIRLDLVNISRNVTLGIVIFLFFFKTAYANYKIKLLNTIMRIINNDLQKGNYLDEDYQDIYDYYIAMGRLGEKIWIVIPVILTSMFPISAASTMIYNEFTDPTRRRVMVHEMELLFFTKRQYDSPYFELAFAYNLIQCVAISTVYVAYDGFFCICTTHLRMKLKLVAHKLNRAFQDCQSENNLEQIFKDAIKDHQEALKFHVLIQDAFGGWLMLLFLLTSSMVSFNLYQLSQPGTADALCITFTIASVGQSFAPCYFAANVTQTAQDICKDLYFLPWHTRRNLKVTKMLIIMIARQQRKMILTGHGIVVYNMELFVSIMHTSYSFYTLIVKSK